MLHEKIEIIGEYAPNDVIGWSIEQLAHASCFKCWKSTDSFGVKPFIETPSLEECALKLMCSGYKFDDIDLMTLSISKQDRQKLKKLMAV